MEAVSKEVLEAAIVVDVFFDFRELNLEDIVLVFVGGRRPTMVVMVVVIVVMVVDVDVETDV